MKHECYQVVSRYPYLCVLSVSLHVSLYKCKQSHVSDVLDVPYETPISKISRNLITVSCSGKSIENTYNDNYPEFIILSFILSLVGLL